MTVAQNIEARDRMTASLCGDRPAGHTSTPRRVLSGAEAVLFGWVYKQDGMATYEDCKAILTRVSVERGPEDAEALLQRFGCRHIRDLWLGLFRNFCEYARTVLYFGASPRDGWATANEIRPEFRDRWLLWHAESDCLYEVRGGVPGELESGEVSDVSGNEKYEKLFIEKSMMSKEEI